MDEEKSLKRLSLTIVNDADVYSIDPGEHELSAHFKEHTILMYLKSSNQYAGPIMVDNRVTLTHQGLLALRPQDAQKLANLLVEIVGDQDEDEESP